jgi:osmotically-inducible protein OsmY
MPTDEKIKIDVTDQLYWDYRVDASDIQVAVEDGVIELEGTVPSFSAKASASDDAWSVDGVVRVENDLDVKYAPSLEIPDDSDIQSNIENIFLWNPHLATYKIDVDVTNGWVTIEGTVDAYWKIIRAEMAAKDVVGVLDVTNNLAVVPTESITDERIAEDVVNAIDRDIRVISDDVSVSVEDGKVTLTGNVPSWTAKSAAYYSALYTYGVKEVDDQLVITP